MKKKVIAKSKTKSLMKLVQTRPDGSVVPMFNENVYGKWAFRVIQNGYTTRLEKMLFGNLVSLPQRFPYGKFKPFKLITT